MTVLLSHVRRHLKMPLAIVVSIAVLAGCEGDSVLPTNPEGGADVPQPGLSAAVSDGASGGSEFVWFLPPFFSDPSGNPAFDAGSSDPSLDVNIRIQCVSDPGSGFCGGFSEVLAPASLMEDVDGGFYFYQYDWKSPRTDVGTVFRALAEVGGSILGFFDLEVVKGNATPAPGNVVLRQGANAPIKVMIEEGIPACEVDTNICVSVVPSEPVEDVLIALEVDDGLEEPDFTVLIPAGTGFQDADGNPVDGATFTLTTCDDMPVDLKLRGECFSATTYPPDLMLVGNRATVSICGIDDDFNPFYSEEQEGRVSIHQFDVADGDPDQIEFWEILPHSPENCPEEFGPFTSETGLFGQLAQAVTGKLLGWLRPEPLVASSLVLDTGGGGQTGTFGSDFQAALTSRIVWPPEIPDEGGESEGGIDEVGPDPVDALVGDPVSPAPAVQVLDVGDEPVPGATVRFRIEQGNGSVDGDPVEVQVMTDEYGIASVEWILDDLVNPHQVRAFAKGMSAPVPMPGGWTAGGDPADQTVLRNECMGTLLGDGCFEGATTDAGVLFEANAFETVAVQGGQVYGVEPLVEEQSVASFYGYDNEEGGGFNASSNTQLTGPGLEASNTSRLFFFQEDGGPLSLVIIHDLPQDLSGGTASFSFSGTGLGSADFVVEDGEGGDIFNFPVAASWVWLPCCTDGGAIGPVEDGFTLTIAATFGANEPNPGPGIEIWELVSFPGDRNSAATQTLNPALPVTFKVAGGGGGD